MAGRILSRRKPTAILTQALQMARSAAAKSPNFGFALERLAEMEFSFGHTDAGLGRP